MKLNPALIEKLQVNLNDTKRHEGINAKEWAKYFIDHNSINPLLNRSYNRDDLIKLRGNDKYSDQDVCIAILSWGGMNREHARKFFSSKEMWVPIVNSLRHGQIEKRDEAYRLFKNLKSKGGLPGMGPAFYTKLIAFVNPDLDGYIMDQWVAKSVN
ncbi:MAG: hypothetical protein P8M34_00650, partial [Saprospiraceae bacterium]|nr:hypothetical protein [Saprospiraceae bacterium]